MSREMIGTDLGSSGESRVGSRSPLRSGREIADSAVASIFACLELAIVLLY